VNRCYKVLAAASVACLLLAAAATTAQARADVYDPLLEVVPDSASVVVGVDHQAMRKHVHYDGLFKFLNSQGFGRSFAALRGAGLEPGKQVKHTLSYRMGRTPAVLVLASNVPAKKVKAHAKKTLKKGFTQGTHKAAGWFTLSKDLIAADAGKGRLLVGPRKGVLAGLDAVGGKNVTSKTRFTSLRKQANRGDAVVWSISFIPKAVREQLKKQGASDMAHVETSTLRITGADALSLEMVGHTTDKKGAAEVAGALNGKIDRKILKNRILNALVGHLVRQLSIKAKGKTVTGKMKLTSEQVAVVAKYGSRVIKLLR